MHTSPGRTAVIVYVCTAEDDAAGLIEGHCARHAAGNDWALATAPVRDSDRRQPLGERPGWQLVLGLLADGAAQGVVTYSSEMIAATPAAVEAAQAQLGRAGGWFLVTSRTSAAAGPLPRRRPGTGWESPAGGAPSSWPDAFAGREGPRAPAAS
jgi:hypothetical protein